MERKASERCVGMPVTAPDNRSVREWYVANVSDIPNRIDRSKSIEEQARQAYELRNRLKQEARAAMGDEIMAWKLRQRFPAPTWEELLQGKMLRKGMTREEAVRDVLRTASVTNRRVNEELGL